MPIGKPEAPTQAAEPAAAESVNSSKAEDDQADKEMVVKWKMGLACFVLDDHPPRQQQLPLIRSQTPHLAPEKGNEQQTNHPGAPTKTPPTRPMGGIVIQEPSGATQPVTQLGSNVASSSRPVVGWQPVFKLGSEPLLATANIKTWAQGEGGRVA